MYPRSLSLCALALCLLGVGGVRAQEESPAAQAEEESHATAVAEHRYRIALVAIRAGDFKTAESELVSATEMMPSNAMLFYNLAVASLCAHEQGRFWQMHDSMGSAHETDFYVR